ncbi:ALF repeat-containing protein [Streptomyces sp. BR123]|uniref:ALF repeat-containing protein n=1 Tax=Streptomyces sp. BR123 TaxID=2749828 RepID=UPI0015C453D9|nr:ALF repeat-containing protein [Streptomyces sp. BR123]NXY93117.1 ALF repeat-containing protein [Streptomyces sp. BR123]
MRPEVLPVFAREPGTSGPAPTRCSGETWADYEAEHTELPELALRNFLEEGQHSACNTDDRVEVMSLLSVGGPATRAAAKLAPKGTPTDVQEFLNVGQHTARNRDQESATVSRLAKQVKEAGAQAERSSKLADDSSKSAVEASRQAKEAAQEARKETEAARNDANRVAVAAATATDAARKAAGAAQQAIAAARGASRAARIVSFSHGTGCRGHHSRPGRGRHAVAALAVAVAAGEPGTRPYAVEDYSYPGPTRSPAP